MRQRPEMQPGQQSPGSGIVGVYVWAVVWCMHISNRAGGNRRVIGPLVVSFIHTANVVAESRLGPAAEHLLRCGAMRLLECGVATTGRQSSELPCGCHCNMQAGN